MIPNMTVTQFLSKLATCSGDEAIDLINLFQSDALYIDGYSASELSDEVNQ